MTDFRRGSVYRVVLAIFIGLAFLFALTWPQYTKHRNVNHARQAGEVARALAFAEETYKQQYGSYTPQFQLLEITAHCPLLQTADGPVLDCTEYTYQLQANQKIRATHKHLPVWLEVTLPGEELSCQHAPGDWAGADLCGRLNRI